jgi:hypothetical protein
MITPNNLPPSNAGIGNRLNIANPSDNNPPNTKNMIHPHSANTNCHTLAAPIGHESLFTVSHLCAVPSCLNIFPSPLSVNLVCSLISCNDAHMALKNGNLIGSISYQTLHHSETHNTQESCGHTIESDSLVPLRSITNKNALPIYVCNTCGNVFVSTAFPSIDTITSFC